MRTRLVRKDRFSLLIDLRNHLVAVVGKPFPGRASIRVDKNPPMECRGERYCIFSNDDAETIVRQLKSGSTCSGGRVRW